MTVIRKFGLPFISIVLFWMAGYYAGKNAADRWYQSHFCLIDFKDCKELLDKASSFGVVTFAGKETINGTSTMIINQGEHCVIYGDGRNFVSVCRKLVAGGAH